MTTFPLPDKSAAASWSRSTASSMTYTKNTTRAWEDNDGDGEPESDTHYEYDSAQDFLKPVGRGCVRSDLAIGIQRASAGNIKLQDYACLSIDEYASPLHYESSSDETSTRIAFRSPSWLIKSRVAGLPESAPVPKARQRYEAHDHSGAPTRSRLRLSAPV